MPTTHTYQYLYDFYSTLPDATSTYPSSFAFVTTISDNADGAVDGQTVVLGKVDWSAYGSDETLWGFTDQGDPIVGHIGGRYFVLSNNPSLTGNLGFTTTGVFEYTDPPHAEPSGMDGSAEIDEDTSHVFTEADFGFSDANDTPADDLAGVVITTLPSAGSLTLNGAAVSAGDTITAADITAGNLVFTPASDGHGDDYASFTFQVVDDAPNGENTDQTPNTFTFDVASVNDAPEGTDGTATIDEDTSHVFTEADFGFSDTNDSPADDFAGVVITTLPGAGTLTLNGAAVNAGDTITAADITAGNLVFTPAAGGNGDDYASLTFQVVDDALVTPGDVFGSYGEGWQFTTGAPTYGLFLDGGDHFAFVQNFLGAGASFETTAAEQPNAVAASGELYELDLTHHAISGYESAAFTVSVYAGATKIGEAVFSPAMTANQDAGTEAFTLTTNVAVPIGEAGEALRVVFTQTSGGHGVLLGIDDVSLSATSGGGNLLANGDFDIPANGENTDQTPNTFTFDVEAASDPFTGDEFANDIVGDANDNEISGLGGKDTLSGNDGNDTISGGDGKDKISGNVGKDKLYGDDGSDILLGGSGSDKLYGGKGSDKLKGGKGNDRLEGGKGDDSLDGGKGSDKLTGNSGNDELFGGDGFDTLNGGNGDDIVVGDDGNDLLLGGKGNDTVSGDAGDDVIWAGQGTDNLEGGLGADEFVFQTGDGVNLINDFLLGDDFIHILSGASEFSDLTVTENGSDVEVTFADVTIILADLDAVDISAADFVF